MEATRPLPWYFLVTDGGRTDGVGVKVQPNAFAAWRVDGRRLELRLDLRSCGQPVELKGRSLEAVTIVTRLILGPLDEWGEGSIGYPNAELGWGMLEAVRDTFGEKPAAGWPVNCAPEDVGLVCPQLLVRGSDPGYPRSE